MKNIHDIQNNVTVCIYRIIIYKIYKLLSILSQTALWYEKRTIHDNIWFSLMIFGLVKRPLNLSRSSTPGKDITPNSLGNLPKLVLGEVRIF